jgi:hypothetical protein
MAKKKVKTFSFLFARAPARTLFLRCCCHNRLPLLLTHIGYIYIYIRERSPFLAAIPILFKRRKGDR